MSHARTSAGVAARPTRANAAEVAALGVDVCDGYVDGMGDAEGAARCAG